MKRLRISYSQILRLRRCPWAWHARHVRGLVPLRRKRPPPAWGDAYHAAAAVVWHARAHHEALRTNWRDDEQAIAEQARAAAQERAEHLDVPGLDCEALARECAQAAVEACASVGPEWRVLWLDGEPVVERELVTSIGEVCGVGVDLVTVIDLALVRCDTGVVRVVDHKTTTSWPEDLGDAMPGEDLADLDLRDDLQVRLYVWALRHALRESETTRLDDEVLTMGDDPIEGAHLVRRASVGQEPPVLTGRGHRSGSLSRAQSIEATEEQWLTAIRRHHLRVEDYQQEIARARLLRWQAWAPVEFTAKSLDLARRTALQAAEDALRYGDLRGDDVPRFYMSGRWQPSRHGKWSGSAPKTGAECFAWAACAACEHRDLCVAEAQGDDEAAALILTGQYVTRDEVRDDASGGDLACLADRDEVD